MSVVYSAMIVTIALYTSFGALGYLVYGGDIESSITLNLRSSVIWLSVYVMQCIVVLVNIMPHPPSQIYG